MTERPRWIWEKTDPDRSGSSGDLAKLFKNEPVKNPGAFAMAAPSDHATLMAREVIQNSSDAARELQDEWGDDAPEFEVEFEFSSLSGDDKEEFVETLDLRNVASRATNPADPAWRAGLGLDSDGTVDHLDDATPLRLLQITERGTSGMYGAFEGANSKMYLALIALGYTAKLEGAGGSYGYGKAGLIRGSGVRMLVAYTAFAEREDDRGVTRRLLGMTYWGQHELGGESYTGFARFGALRPDGAVHPLENDEADDVAQQLGIDLRDASDPDQLGTTFLLVEPTVAAADLDSAIARNWWPAIEDGQLTATIINDGHYIMPRPMKDPLLRTFVDAYHLAVTNQDATRPERYRRQFRKTSIGDREVTLGSLGIMAQPGGWSYEEDPGADGVEHRSLVALVRGPRMVVEYLDVGRTRPFVRGVFVADPDVDDLLRQTEPKAHDAWQTTVEEPGIDPIAFEVARTVQNRIKNHVGLFRDRLKPDARPAETARLPELNNLFGRMFGGRGGFGARPDAGERSLSIQVTEEVVSAGEGSVRLEGTAAIALSDHAAMNELPAAVTLAYTVLEEGGLGEELALAVRSPSGFEVIDGERGRYRGLVGRDGDVFHFSSDPYPADWTARLKVEAEVLATEDVNS